MGGHVQYKAQDHGDEGPQCKNQDGTGLPRQKLINIKQSLIIH